MHAPAVSFCRVIFKLFINYKFWRHTVTSVTFVCSIRNSQTLPRIPMGVKKKIEEKAESKVVGSDGKNKEKTYGISRLHHWGSLELGVHCWEGKLVDRESSTVVSPTGAAGVKVHTAIECSFARLGNQLTTSNYKSRLCETTCLKLVLVNEPNSPATSSANYKINQTITKKNKGSDWHANSQLGKILGGKMWKA